MRPRFDFASSSIWLIVAGTVTLVIGVAVSISLSRNPDLLLYSFTQWSFTYDHGFIKRALIGELLSYWVSPEQLLATVQVLAIVVSIVVSCVLLVLFFRPFLRTTDAGLLAFAVFAATHSGTLQHFFYDQGRFDHIGLLLMLLCVWAARSMRVFATALVVLAAGIVGILIHEVYLALFLPLIFAHWIARQREHRLAASIRALVAIALVGLTIVSLRNGAPPLTLNDYVASLRGLHGSWISERSVQALYSGVAIESERSLALLLTPRRLLQHFILGLFLLPTILLLKTVVRRYAALVHDRWDGQELRSCAILIAGLSPLAMYFVGIDFARWWSIAITNLLLALALCAGYSERWRAAIAYGFASRPALLWTAILSNALSGPLGVAASAFPRIEPYVQGLYSVVRQGL